MPKMTLAPKKKDLELALDASVRIMMNLDKGFCLNFPRYEFMPAWERLIVDKIASIEHEQMEQLVDRVFPTDPRQLEIPTEPEEHAQTHEKRAPAREAKPRKRRGPYKQYERKTKK